MKKNLILVLFIAFLMGCSKDKFKTQPQIKIKSYNTKEVQRNQDLVIQLSFTDKEGDLANGKFTYMPRRTNLRPPPPGVRYPDSVKVNIPQFPTSDNGDFELRLNWNVLHLSDRENDSLFFRFVVMDKAGNKSDTVNSDRIVIMRQ
ncbi:MAG: hypothetical protein ICV84_15865 [Flavisolibacter sp.]|nr:hypothetical protein [Flavisolibacter sp.]MBD0296650.1 hypothetical protein [Flavisolibacter sp.]MBD0352600.1 hypothetical protein [Flavisolibacter sp.]